MWSDEVRSWRKIAITLISRSRECKRLWVLKKSLFLKTAEILRIENVYQNRDRRLWGFLLQSFFDDFLSNDFFNSHRRLHKLAPSVRWSLGF